MRSKSAFLHFPAKKSRLNCSGLINGKNRSSNNLQSFWKETEKISQPFLELTLSQQHGSPQRPTALNGFTALTNLSAMLVSGRLREAPAKTDASSRTTVETGSSIAPSLWSQSVICAAIQ